jgi:hypothetical protein
MQPFTRVMTAAAGAAVLGLGAWAPAHADPVHAKNSLPITIVCDNGQSYSAITNGSGAWTPAHDLASTAMLIPVSFGEITFTVTAPDGTVLDQETQPPTAKAGASAHNRHAATSCSFSGSASAPDGTTFTIEGTVTGFVTPA